MEIPIKVLTFCGGAAFLVFISAIVTSFLFKYCPHIINKILRG